MAIYTCTMNLAIDLVIETEQLVDGKVNRTLSNDIQANGKGINVSFILKQLGIDNQALGFSAGFTGQYIADVVTEKGIKQSFISVPGQTRINVFTKVRETGEEFKLVNAGPQVSLEAQEMLLAQIRLLKKDDFLVVSGSLPMGVKSDILLDIAKICNQNGVNVILDVSDPILLDCLAYKPYLVKPNDEELAEWFDVDLFLENNISEYIERLQKLGAQRILLSLGEQGAKYRDSDGTIYSCNAPKGEVVNTACSGDTLLATFLAGIVQNQPIEAVLSKSVAAGSSTAFRSGLTDFNDVPILQQQIIVKKEESK